MDPKPWLPTWWPAPLPAPHPLFPPHLFPQLGSILPCSRHLPLHELPIGLQLLHLGRQIRPGPLNLPGLTLMSITLRLAAGQAGLKPGYLLGLTAHLFLQLLDSGPTGWWGGGWRGMKEGDETVRM
jgi:hypothetical protein